jgi:hypothetical protein
MCDYHNQFKERLTAETYIKFTEDSENVEEEGERLS